MHPVHFKKPIIISPQVGVEGVELPLFQACAVDKMDPHSPNPPTLLHIQIPNHCEL